MRKKYRIVIYCRTASQDDRGNTLEKQSARLHGLARLSNMTIVGEVFECGNGIARQRPGWNKALEIAAEKGANAIFVTDYSRIAHDWDTMIDAMLDAFDRGLEFITADDEQPFYLFINTLMWLERWNSVKQVLPITGAQNLAAASAPCVE